MQELSNFHLARVEPNLQTSPQSIELDTQINSHLTDGGKFDLRFAHDMIHVSKVSLMTSAGQKYTHMMYSYRSISRTIPEIDAKSDDANDRFTKLNIYIYIPVMSS